MNLISADLKRWGFVVVQLLSHVWCLPPHGLQHARPLCPPLRLRRGLILAWDFPGGSVVKHPSASAGNAGDVSFIPGLGRSLRGGNGNPLQYSCLENPMDRETWWATVHGVPKNQKWLSKWAYTQYLLELTPLITPGDGPKFNYAWPFGLKHITHLRVWLDCTTQERNDLDKKES